MTLENRQVNVLEVGAYLYSRGLADARTQIERGGPQELIEQKLIGIMDAFCDIASASVLHIWSAEECAARIARHYDQRLAEIHAKRKKEKTNGN